MSPIRSLSPLQTKGILTLTLFVLAETVTFTNAVSFWSKYQKIDDRFKEGKTNGFFFQKASAGDCPAAATTARTSSSPVLLGKLNLFRRKTSQVALMSDAECMQTCQNSCRSDKSRTTTTAATMMCRGGHQHHHHNSHNPAVEAAAAAAASITPYNIPLHIWKVIFQAFLTALNVACWLIPLRSKKISENKLAMSLANAFSGGVFLSLAFGHLIPECVHGFHDYSEAAPFMFVLAGYLLIFFVEKVAFDAHDILHEMEHAGEDSCSTPAASAVRGGHGSHGHKAVAAGPHTNGQSPAASSGRSALILLGALGVHSILEMMALGLADSFGDCALLTVSISLHQPAESIALLVAFLKSGLSKGQIIRYLSIFSCMGPIGVLLGMLVNEYAAPIVDSIMLAVVAGTFVYVGATEVIPEEWEDSKHKWKKFAALMSGIVSIFTITQYTMSLGGH
jgi:solute carrier family 39 (zinc transporter), member 1/2/3